MFYITFIKYKSCFRKREKRAGKCQSGCEDSQLCVCRDTSVPSKALPLDWAYGKERAFRNGEQHLFDEG